MSALQVTHVIAGLGGGGAERVLVRLLLHSSPQAVQHTVVTLSRGGRYTEPLRRAGIAVVELDVNKSPLRSWRSLVQELRRQAPDVLQTWMYHADLLGGLAARRAGISRVVWNVRQTNPRDPLLRPRTRWTIRACRLLASWIPLRIVTCGEAAAQTHAAFGYPATRLHVISNGFDVERFCPNPAARAQLRADLGLGSDVPLVGLVARFDPFKGFDIWAQAAQELVARRPEVQFALAGEGINASNAALLHLLSAAGLRERCHLLGFHPDPSALYNAFDIYVSPSWGEGFPNAVGEAMASGVPCVVTDVGDSARLVGQTGAVVPPGDAPALVRALLALVDLPPAERQHMGLEARSRIVGQFSLTRMVEAYTALYQSLVRL